MLIFGRLSGSGTAKDAFRFDFPTYRLVAIHEPSRRLIAEVPDEDVPAEVQTRMVNGPWVPGGPLFVGYLTPEVAEKWNGEIRRKYPHKFGKWKSEEQVSETTGPIV